MSVRAIDRVWEGFPGSGSELLALLALADWSDDEGRCFPSIAAIARKTRLSRSQAQRVMHRLIDQGFLRVIENVHGGPPGSTRKYGINFQRLARCTDARGRTDATGRTDAQDGPHLCAETGRADATQTVIEPSITVKGRNTVKPDSSQICPHNEIIALYHELLPTASRVRVWTSARERALRARWREKKLRQDLDWWKRFFTYVGKSDFLMGRVSSPGRRPFAVSLMWLVNAENFAKVIEGSYENQAEEATA